jgi:LppX_LprAFG lipoprotein
MHRPPASSQYLPRRNTHTAYIFGFSALALMLMLAACGGDNGPSTPDVHTLIKDAQTAIQQVKSYHFNLVVQNPGADGTLPIQSADGDILVPDKLHANAKALVAGSVIPVEIIAIGNQQYVNLLGNWQPVSNLLDPRTLSDPQSGVSAILGHIQNPTTPTSAQVDGRDCWSFNGKLDPTYLTAISGGGAPPGTLDDVTACIGKSDKLPYQIIVKGIATQGDTAKTVRTLKLSKFNEQITIEPPPGVSPPATPTP